MDGRWNHLRDVAGVSVILGTVVLPGSSSLFRWAISARETRREFGWNSCDLAAWADRLAISFQPAWRQKGQVPAADFRRLERGIESVSAVVLRFVDLIVGR